MAPFMRLALLSSLLLVPSSSQPFSFPQALQQESDKFEDAVFLLSTSIVVSKGGARHQTLKIEDSESEDLSLSGHAPWTFYHYSIIPLIMMAGVAAWFTRPRVDNPEELTPVFRNYRYKFLSVWALAAAADWLQGPYVYALYDSFGYGKSDIDKLFVTGFCASMIFGTFAGSLTDAWGRKRTALVYCLLYIASCCTKHCSSYSVLMLGRILGGMATSLLFSAFECWMVSESNQRYQFGTALLRYMFSLMYFVNYLVAIVSGLVAEMFVQTVPMRRIQGFDSLHYGGNICPFDLAIVVLCFAFVLICYTWSENYGNSDSLSTLQNSKGKEGVMEAFSAAFTAITTSWKVAILGLVVACFEGSMYCFVINWTPTLHVAGAPNPPHGLIFSALMMCCMTGSSIFSFVNPAINPARILVFACTVAALSFAMVAHVCEQAMFVPLVYMSFLVFEGCAGLYFASMGAMKSELVPEEARAGIYNWYRVPMNLVVCTVILTDMSLRTAFTICACLMAIGAIVMSPLANVVLPSQQESTSKLRNV